MGGGEGGRKGGGGRERKEEKVKRCTLRTYYSFPISWLLSSLEKKKGGERKRKGEKKGNLWCLGGERVDKEKRKKRNACGPNF